MVNSIIEAIAVALNGEFGDDCKIYTEENKQGFTEPCFFISCINPTNDLFLGRRYFRKNQFVIQYFPVNEQEERRECNSVADRLYVCLEWVDVKGRLAMGTKMYYEIVDGVLSFFVNYDCFAYKKKETPIMEDLVIKYE